MLNIRRNYQYLENVLRTISDFIFLIIGCLLYKKNLLTIPIFVIIYNYQPKIKDLLTSLVQILEYNKKDLLCRSAFHHHAVHRIHNGLWS